jgi:hypothetical protein
VVGFSLGGGVGGGLGVMGVCRHLWGVWGGWGGGGFEVGVGPGVSVLGVVE